MWQQNEALDSLSIRFVQVGATPPDTVYQSVSSAKLSIVDDDVSQTVNGALQNEEQYTLQLHAIDLLGLRPTRQA